MGTSDEQQIIDDLQANWIWVPQWEDSSSLNTAGRIVRFKRLFDIPDEPNRAVFRISADTRYKLFVNGIRVAVGPSRSSPAIWYYDTVDISPYLRTGTNEILILVMRYFARSRGAMPFARTSFPGLTTLGHVEAGGILVDLSSKYNWEALPDHTVLFPMGRVDDVFLHINEQVVSSYTDISSVTPVPYGFKTLNGELAPWRLRPRAIPLPEEIPLMFEVVRVVQSSVDSESWASWLSEGSPLTLPSSSEHIIELQAPVHSTAFMKWSFLADHESEINIKLIYSEGYENEPRSYPFFRTKTDRLDYKNGYLIGPYDEASISIPAGRKTEYEPFWFRTFRIVRAEMTITGDHPVQIMSPEACQVNYPMSVKATWKEPGDSHSEEIWNVSVRTMRNCMFDGYSDCPFYEQLQYSGDTRAVALFHYLLSGDDRLMRQAITNFAASITPEGLTQSRFPSQVPQLIAGFSLYWILQVCDHFLFFGDKEFSRSFVPRIDGVLEFFDSHVDSRGLVSGIPQDVWQYVDWVTAWGATEEHPDKGVPTSGRISNCHTYFSMLYAYVLKQAAQLLCDVGRHGNASEYVSRSESIIHAVRIHCFDGNFFTDSTADIANETAYSQHCQVFAVLSGAAMPGDSERLLTESFADRKFSKCSYMMQFYALRAFSLAGDTAYEKYWVNVWDPWRQMLSNNLSTWEEDDVRQRSDCHAWGSVPIYEYCTELAGVRPIAPGWKKLLFKPRLSLSESVTAKVAVGSGNLAIISWNTGVNGEKHVSFRLEKPVAVVTHMPNGVETEYGMIDTLSIDYSEPS